MTGCYSGPELAETIMRSPLTTWRLTHAIVQRPWKRRLVHDLGFGIATERGTA